MAADVTFGSKWTGCETKSAAANTKFEERGEWGREPTDVRGRERGLKGGGQLQWRD